MSDDISKCPVMGSSAAASGTVSNRDWWPNQLNLKILHQNTPRVTRWTMISITPLNSKHWI